MITCDGTEKPRSVWWAYKAYGAVGESLYGVVSTDYEVADGVVGMSKDDSLVTMSLGFLGASCPGSACPGNDTTSVSLSLLNLPLKLAGAKVEVSVAWIESSGTKSLEAPRVVHLVPQSAGFIELAAVASGSAAFVAVGTGAAAVVEAFAQAPGDK